MDTVAIAVAQKPIPIHFASDSKSTVPKVNELLKLGKAPDKLDEDKITGKLPKDYLKP